MQRFFRQDRSQGICKGRLWPGKNKIWRTSRFIWKRIDPTDPDGQFADREFHYKTAIYYHNEEQMRLAKNSKEKLQASGRFERPIVTEVLKVGPFIRRRFIIRIIIKLVRSNTTLIKKVPADQGSSKTGGRRKRSVRPRIIQNLLKRWSRKNLRLCNTRSLREGMRSRHSKWVLGQ